MLLPPIICVDYLHQFNRFMQILLTYMFTRQYYKLILWLLIVFILHCKCSIGRGMSKLISQTVCHCFGRSEFNARRYM